MKARRSHPLFDIIQRLREAYLSLGFEELVNPLVIEEADIVKQWGREAPVILDRCYYLADLPRPDVGMSAEKVAAIKKLGITVTERKKVDLQGIFHRYRKGDIDSEELMEQVAETLNTTEERALLVMGKFPELKRLKPSPTHLTLRSHMTSGWFLTLGSLGKRRPLPIRLFSIDRCFRREQKEDETHLRTHHSASCVVMDRELNEEVGKEVARGLLHQFGFKDRDIKFSKKKRSASYYAPDTETEVYARYKKSGWIEVADFGLYAPHVLRKYDIEHPVMNLGLGAERLAMMLNSITDIRELVYPQFYAEWLLSDEEIAKLIRIESTPKTQLGMGVAKAVVATCGKRGEAPSPCEFVAHEGKVGRRRVKVVVREKEKGKKLLGPAAFNEIVVYKGNIVGLPRRPLGKETALIREARKKGVHTGIRYLDGIANAAAVAIEKAAKEGKNSAKFRVPIVKAPGDVNVLVDDVARRYVTSKGLKIDVRGPVFFEIIAAFQ